MCLKFFPLNLGALIGVFSLGISAYAFDRNQFHEQQVGGALYETATESGANLVNGVPVHGARGAAAVGGTGTGFSKGGFQAARNGGPAFNGAPDGTAPNVGNINLPSGVDTLGANAGAENLNLSGTAYVPQNQIEAQEFNQAFGGGSPGIVPGTEADLDVANSLAGRGNPEIGSALAGGSNGFDAGNAALGTEPFQAPDAAALFDEDALRSPIAAAQTLGGEGSTGSGGGGRAGLQDLFGGFPNRYPDGRYAECIEVRKDGVCEKPVRISMAKRRAAVEELERAARGAGETAGGSHSSQEEDDGASIFRSSTNTASSDKSSDKKDEDSDSTDSESEDKSDASVVASKTDEKTDGDDENAGSGAFTRSAQAGPVSSLCSKAVGKFGSLLRSAGSKVSAFSKSLFSGCLDLSSIQGFANQDVDVNLEACRNAAPMKELSRACAKDLSSTRKISDFGAKFYNYLKKSCSHLKDDFWVSMALNSGWQKNARKKERFSFSVPDSVAQHVQQNEDLSRLNPKIARCRSVAETVLGLQFLAASPAQNAEEAGGDTGSGSVPCSGPHCQ